MSAFGCDCCRHGKRALRLAKNYGGGLYGPPKLRKGEPTMTQLILIIASASDLLVDLILRSAVQDPDGVK